jgi:hypothetical protein
MNHDQAVAAARYDAAVALERSRQIARENGRYGRSTDRDLALVQNADRDYERATNRAAYLPRQRRAAA